MQRYLLGNVNRLFPVHHHWYDKPLFHSQAFSMHCTWLMSILFSNIQHCINFIILNRFWTWDFILPNDAEFYCIENPPEKKTQKENRMRREREKKKQESFTKIHSGRFESLWSCWRSPIRLVFIWMCKCSDDFCKRSHLFTSII